MVWTNELRSEESQVGLVVKLSSTQEQVATIGYSTNILDKPKLVLFRSILLPVKRSITLPYSVPDFDFFGNDVIMTSNEVVDQKSVLHWIQKVNNCFEIVTTRDVTHDTIINKLTDIFEVCSVRNNFVVLIRKKRDNQNQYHEVAIELYKVEDDLQLYASIDLEQKDIQLFSNISCSSDGSTLAFQSYNSGNLSFSLYY